MIDTIQAFENISRAYDSVEDKIKSFNYWRDCSRLVKAAAAENNVSIEKLCAMTAIMSSGSGIRKGLEYSLSIVKDMNEGKRGDAISLVGSFGWENINKAIDVFQNGITSDNLKGQKVTATHYLLVDPESHVVAIGSNEKRVAVGDYDTKIIKVSPKEATALIEVVRAVAEQKGVRGSDVQSVINAYAHTKLNEAVKGRVLTA